MKPNVVKVIFQTFLPYQGRYPRVSGQSRILIEEGYDVTVLGCDREGKHPSREIVEGIPVERIKVRTREMRGPILQFVPLLLFYMKSFFWLYRRDFDIIHCHNMDVLPLGYILKKIKKCRLVFDAHEPNYYALWPKKWKFIINIIDKIDAFFSKRTDAVTVTNNYQIKKYREINVKRVELIGNYPPPGLRITDISERKIPEGVLIFGRFGTFYPNIGIEETMESYKKIVESYSDVRFILGGRVVDSYKDSFYKITESIKDSIEYIGQYEARDMLGLYKKIDASCMIYPKNDWFRNITPRKYFDSLSNGVPVIMTDIGGLGEVIRKYKCGIVVDENDLNSIFKAMELLVKDRTLVREMSVNALALANSEYSWSKLVEKYTKLMEDIYGS